MNLLKETIGNTSIEEYAQRIHWAKVSYISSEVQCGEKENESNSSKHILKPNHTIKEAIDFLKSLDFEYDNGYGLQEVFGTIVFNNNTWLTRYEYDGSECWETHCLPSWEE